jgi:ABC-2 type transport system permease protein
LITLRTERRAATAVIYRNFSLIRRYLGWELVFAFYNAVNALTIGLIGLAQPGPGQGVRVLYLSIGALLWNFLSVLFFEVSNSVMWERWEGTIEYSFMAPIRRVTYLFGVCAYAIVYGLVRTLIVLVAIALFFHLPLAQADLPGALLVLAASSVPFIGLGLFGAIMPMLSAERGAQATQVIQGVILLVSGIYYPISVLPKWLQAVSWFSPATYTLNAVRDATISGANVGSLLPTVFGLLAAGAVLVPAGLYAFSVAERYALRAGKLKRNG